MLLGCMACGLVIGHNVDLTNLAGIEDGTQIATLDQNYLAQAQFPALACADYLKTGKILPNTNVPIVIDSRTSLPPKPSSLRRLTQSS